MTDDQLRDLLRGTVDDVQPRGDFEDVRHRLEEKEPSRRRWAPLVVAVAAAVAIITGGTAWMAQHLGQTAARDTSAAGTNTIGRDVDATLYFVGDTANGPRLFAEQHRLSGVTGR